LSPARQGMMRGGSSLADAPSLKVYCNKP